MAVTDAVPGEGVRRVRDGDRRRPEEPSKRSHTMLRGRSGETGAQLAGHLGGRVQGTEGGPVSLRAEVAGTQDAPPRHGPMVRASLAAPPVVSLRGSGAPPPGRRRPTPGRGRAAPTSRRRLRSGPATRAPGAGSRVNGAGFGPSAPVSTLRVVMASPRNRASTDGTCTATLPGVCPGTCTIRGDPGTSSTSPSATVTTSVTGGMRKPPLRAEYQRNPARGPTFTRPQPRFGFFTSSRARSTSDSWTWAGIPCSWCSHDANPMWSESPWVSTRAEMSSSDRPIEASSCSSRRL